MYKIILILVVLVFSSLQGAQTPIYYRGSSIVIYDIKDNQITLDNGTVWNVDPEDHVTDRGWYTRTDGWLEWPGDTANILVNQGQDAKEYPFLLDAFRTDVYQLGTVRVQLVKGADQGKTILLTGLTDTELTTSDGKSYTFDPSDRSKLEKWIGQEVLLGFMDSMEFPNPAHAILIHVPTGEFVHIR